MAKESLFDALGGAAAVFGLAQAWHERVLADEVVAHAFSHGFHPQHTERLAAYWGEAWGGPATYSTQYGSESSVVRMHSGNGPHDDMDRRAIACFAQALDDIAIPDPTLRR
ncbi:MAG: oxidoreductase, partial [Gemmatimonadales bacterium]